MSKRKFLSDSSRMLGLTYLLEHLPSKRGILIMNHHRIGMLETDPFDRAVISATAEELDFQVGYLKKKFPILSGSELEDILLSEKPLKHLHVAITFDDGYLDNYTTAFPILQSHAMPAIFFLVSDFVGSNAIPWWDEIAYLMRHTELSELVLTTPGPTKIGLSGDRAPQIKSMLRRYVVTPAEQQADLLNELRAQANVKIPPQPRRFLDWDEARRMVDAGMTIGAHTRTHPVLSRLTPDDQRSELQTSKAEIEARLGRPVTTLAYPIGGPEAFDSITEKIATDAGFRLCFT